MKLLFPLQSIPTGKSHQTISVKPDDVPDFPEDIVFEDGDLEIDFYKTDHFLKVDFHVTARVKLVCDRSLRQFTQRTDADYTILFKPDLVEETETEASATRQIKPQMTAVDIGDEVRDSILLSLPLQHIHPDYIGDDGKIEEFQTKTFGTFDEHSAQTDPRWDALKKLKNSDSA